MKTKTKNRILTFNEGISAASGVITLAVPWCVVIPLIMFVINRTVGFISDEDIIERLKKIEKKLKSKKIDIEEFKDKISNLSEHERFFSSSTLETIIKDCIPETVDIYISLFIDYIMASQNDLEEELCEIISSLNKHDLELLMYIKDYLKRGSRETYKKELKIDEENRKEFIENKLKNGIQKFYNRSIFLGEDKTIFWDDFSSFCNLPKLITLNSTMLFTSYKDMDHITYSNWNYYGKSFIKLERCGILQLDYLSFLGTMNNMEINRFHLTTLGLELLKYIKI